jgi:hypothetical protein
MALPSQIVLLGGGFSIREGIEKGLFDFLQDKFCIGINYSFNFVDTTAQLGVDEVFYNTEYDKLKSIELFIGKEHPGLYHRALSHIFLKPSKEYDRDLKIGVYKQTLSGIFALSLAIKLLDYSDSTTERVQKKIFICGFDYGPAKDKDGKILVDSSGKPLTHFYQDKLQHRGTGKINWYTATTLDTETRKRITHAEKEFSPYAKESKVKIYNVGLDSMIPTFEKISYDQFFSHTFDKVYNQAALRTELKEVLWAIKKENKI